MQLETINQSVVMPASPHAVYEAFLDPATHTAMTGGAATGEVKVGGKFTAWDRYITGEYRELVPDEKIVAFWETAEWPDGYPPSILTLEFRSHPDGTEISMTHADVPAEQVALYDPGWHESYWEPMARYFAKKGE